MVQQALKVKIKVKVKIKYQWPSSEGSSLHTTSLGKVEIPGSQYEVHKMCAVWCHIKVKHHKLGTIWFLRLPLERVSYSAWRRVN